MATNAKPRSNGNSAPRINGNATEQKKQARVRRLLSMAQRRTAGPARRFVAISRFVRQRFLRLMLTLLFATAAITAALAYYYSRPETLKIAVAETEDGADVKLMTSVAQYLDSRRSSVRLKVVKTKNLADAASAVDNKSSELALLRADVATPLEGRVIIGVKRNFLVIVATPASKIKTVADLKGKKIGLIGQPDIDIPFFQAVLRQYDLPVESAKPVPLAAREAVNAIREKQFDALVAIGPVNGENTSAAVSALTRNDLKPVFVEVSEADAIAQFSRGFESKEIVAGAFGGAPARPEESVDTLTAMHFIFANPRLGEPVAGELAKTLFALRSTLGREQLAMARFEAPDTENTAVIPVHQGALDYFKGEGKTFFDRYGDWIYLIAIFGGTLASGIAAFASYLKPIATQDKVSLLSHLLSVARAARETDKLADLTMLQQKLDEIFMRTMGHVEDGLIDQTRLLAISMALDQTSRAIADRRMVLEAKPARK